MNAYKMVKLQENPQIKDRLARWFHEKWGIPQNAYLDSMDNCLRNEAAIPQWYCMMDDDTIIGGIGVIANDFHNRKDLTPNVCAVYVEEAYRGRGIAGQMLNFVCSDMKKQGINILYLITDHTDFYERYDWEFYCMVQGDGEPHMARMYRHRS